MMGDFRQQMIPFVIDRDVEVLHSLYGHTPVTSPALETRKILMDSLFDGLKNLKAMNEWELADTIKGVIFIDREGNFLPDFKLSESNDRRFDHPVLTANDFFLLSSQGEPFSILKIIIDNGEVVKADIVMGITAVPKRQPVSFTFSEVGDETTLRSFVDLWSHYIADTDGKIPEEE